MGLFGRSRKSEADKTLEQLQAAADVDWKAAAQSNVVSSGSGVDGVGFAMSVANAFSITGRGLVVTGTIESGTVTVGQKVSIVSVQHGRSQPRSVAGIECRGSMTKSAHPGDEIGLLIRDLTRDDVSSGDRVTG